MSMIIMTKFDAKWQHIEPTIKQLFVIYVYIRLESKLIYIHLLYFIYMFKYFAEERLVIFTLGDCFKNNFGMLFYPSSVIYSSSVV